MVNIFQYLENKKGKPMPLKYKLINNSPLTDNELIYNHNLNLSYSRIKSLPDNLTVNGYLDLSYTIISELPDNLTVNGNLYCVFSPLADNIKKDVYLLTKYQKQINGKIIYE